MATFTICDKCGRRLPPGTTILRVIAEGHGPVQPSTPPRRLEDVCGSCVNQIMEPYPQEATPRGS